MLCYCTQPLRSPLSLRPDTAAADLCSPFFSAFGLHCLSSTVAFSSSFSFLFLLSLALQSLFFHGYNTALARTRAHHLFCCSLVGCFSLDGQLGCLALRWWCCLSLQPQMKLSTIRQQLRDEHWTQPRWHWELSAVAVNAVPTDAAVISTTRQLVVTPRWDLNGDLGRREGRRQQRVKEASKDRNRQKQRD